MGTPNWADKTVWTRDCLEVMRGMNSGSVDLIYLDPPFNSKADYSAPVGSKAAGAHFRDTWTLRDVDVEWINIIEREHPALYRVLLAAMTASDKSYLAYMAVRLLEMRRILKDTGSIYLHCDPTMSHYLKWTMDAIFGRQRFRNEIVWDYTFRLMDLPRFFNRKHDLVLFYGMSRDSTFNMPKTPWTREEIIKTRKQKIHLSETGEELIWMPGGRGNSKSRLKPLAQIMAEGKAVSDVWRFPIISSSAKERTGYPTQKPLALLERIIRASSDEGDTVLDPFCGCATTMVAANTLGRQWAGIDLSAKAGELVMQRMQDRGELFGKTVLRTDIPKRTDLGPLPKPGTHRRRLYGEQEGRCNWCREHFVIGNLEVDHIIARASGGTDHLDNLQLLCARCNRIKGDRGMEYLRTKLQIGAVR